MYSLQTTKSLATTLEILPTSVSTRVYRALNREAKRQDKPRAQLKAELDVDRHANGVLSDARYDEGYNRRLDKLLEAQHPRAAPAPFFSRELDDGSMISIGEPHHPSPLAMPFFFRELDDGSMVSIGEPRSLPAIRENAEMLSASTAHIQPATSGPSGELFVDRRRSPEEISAAMQVGAILNSTSNDAEAMDLDT